VGSDELILLSLEGALLYLLSKWTGYYGVSGVGYARMYSGCRGYVISYNLGINTKLLLNDFILKSFR
jgi:hypothetical protein